MTQTIKNEPALVKTPSVPLVHGNSDFHLMRYKQRAFSNYGQAKATTIVAKQHNQSAKNLEIVSDNNAEDNLG